MPPSKRPAKRVIAPSSDTLTEALEPEDDDDTPAPRRPALKGAKPSSTNGIRGGETEAQRQMDATSTFAQALRIEEKSQVIKFLDDVPYANYRRHWIERTTKDGKSIRAYTCLQTIDKPCPLCDAGDRAQSVAAYNIALVGDDGQVLVKTWDCGPRLFQQLKGYNHDAKVGPLTKGFFLVSKSGKRGTVAHNINPIRASSLLEEYDIEPPAQADLDALKRYDADIIEIPPVKTLKELAAELGDYDDD